MRYTFFFNFRERKAQNVRKQSEQDTSANMLLQTVTLATAIFLSSTGQARLDGAFCGHSEEEKMNFLRRAHTEGIKNIEMESLGFAACSFRAGIKSKYFLF